MSPSTAPQIPPPMPDRVELVSVAVSLLRRRRFIWMLSGVGMLFALALTLALPRRFVAKATFIPQRSETAASGLAAAASQLGLRVPTQDAGWGAVLYVALLRSNAVLGAIAQDSFAREPGARPIPISMLLDIDEEDPARRLELTIRKIREEVVSASDDKLIGSVTVTVSTKWPHASFGIARALIDQVNRFNVEARNEQAAVERKFAEVQSQEAEQKLREAEDRLQQYLESNRAIGGSPELTVRRDRLQREVVLRQQVLTSLLQNREEARLREVRDTPGITVLEGPESPALPVSRNLVAKLAFGAIAGALLAIVGLLVGDARARAYGHPSVKVRELAELVDEMLPKALRGRRTGSAS